MQVRQIDVSSKGDVKKWIEFPFELYKGCAQWVPPLIEGERNLLDPTKHPFYQHSQADFFLAEVNGRTLGRIAAMENRRYNEHNRERAAFFGFFEVVEDIQAARALFERVVAWALERGLNIVYGPKGLIGADAAGILVEGFEHRPALTIPYNYPYYDAFIKDSGFVKERDGLSGYLSGLGEMPERLIQIAERVKKRRGFWIKEFNNKDDLRAMAPAVSRVHEQAFGAGYGFYPHTEEEMAWVADELLTIADPRLVKLVMRGEDVIGFLFTYHDVSEGLQKAKGQLWPLGWLHLLMARRRTKWANVNGLGIIPEYQGLGANTVLYTELAKTIKAFGFEHIETVLIGEENYRSFSDNEALGVTWYKRHRLYKRRL